MAAPERQPDRRRWIIWTLISAGGWFLACFGGVTLAAVIWLTLFTQAGGVSEFAYIGLTAIICGAIGGWCQWLLLRHYLQQTSHWIIVTIVSWLVGALCWEVISRLASIPFNVASILGVIGVSQGIGQWYMLRRESRGLWWWPLVTTSAGILGGVIWHAVFDALNEGVRLATLNDPFADESRSIGAVMSAAQATAVTGIVIGLITGSALSVVITRLDISHRAARLDHNQR